MRANGFFGLILGLDLILTLAAYGQQAAATTQPPVIDPAYYSVEFKVVASQLAYKSCWMDLVDGNKGYVVVSHDYFHCVTFDVGSMVRGRYVPSGRDIELAWVGKKGKLSWGVYAINQSVLLPLPPAPAKP